MAKQILAFAVVHALSVCGLAAFAMSSVHAQNPPPKNPSPPQTATQDTDALAADGAEVPGKPVLIEKVRITGSSIKRVQGEGPAPVEIITREEIERSGATNVNELTRSIPSIDIADIGELASNSPSGSGTGRIRLRGLDETNALILLNGRRLPVRGIHDSSGAGAAVDINMIPLSMIERIEILKDGGSAVYGADAVSGVVNFITKKDYNGLEATFGFGQSSRGDGTEKSVAVTGGFGDLDNDGYNLMLTVNSFQRDPILRKDRDISRSDDFRRFGGVDARSIFAPQGNFLRPNGQPTGQSIVPCPPEMYSGYCRYDANASILAAYNGADRQGAMALGTIKLSPNVLGFAQIVHSRSEDNFEANPAADFFRVPQGTGVIAGRFMQGGPRITDRTSTLDHFVLGMEGTTAEIEWDVAYSEGRSKVTNRDSNYFDARLLPPAIQSGAINPTVTTNDPALVESMKISPLRVGESEIKSLDAKLSGEAMQMRAGPLAYALGASFWREALTDTPDPLIQQGLVVGSIRQSPASAEREAKAMFAELNIPLMKNLEVQAALRRDIYDNAAKTSPKIAARWEVLPQLALRASYAESFRMPTLKQLYGTPEESAIAINNAGGAANCQGLGLPPNCNVPAFRIRGPNPDLEPEKGQTINVGVIFEIGRVASGTLDYWRIKKDDAITTPKVDQAIVAGNLTRQGNPLRTVVYTNLENFAKEEIAGLDLELDVRVGKTPLGTLSLRNAATYYLAHRRQEGPGAEWEYLKDSYARPKWRNVFGATLESGPWSTSLMWRYVGGFFDSDVYPTGSRPRPANQRRVPSYDELDLQVSYSGFRSLKLSFGAKNVLDAQPPFSAQNAASSAYTRMGFAELYTNRGRFYYLNASYTFK